MAEPLAQKLFNSNSWKTKEKKVKIKVKRAHLRNSSFKIIVLFALQQGDLGYVNRETGTNMYFGVTNKSVLEDPS